MEIFLNGNRYVLESGTNVRRVPLVEWPDNTRLDGQQQRKDRTLLSSWAIDRWSQGLGLERMNVDIASQKYRLWDVENCDTRHDFGIILSPQFNVVTISPSIANLDLAFQYLSEQYFVKTNGTVSAGLVYKFTPPLTLGSLSILDGASGKLGSISVIRSFGGQILYTAVPSSVGDNMTNLRSVAGIGSQGVVRGSLGQNIIVRPQIGDFGGTVHVLSYLSERVRFYTTNQDFGGFAGVGSVAMIVGTYLAPLVTDGLTMWAQLPNGVYDFDDTPALAVDTSRAMDKNCMQTMFQNNLYFKNKNSLIKYDGVEPIGVGYDLEDGLPSDKLGEITAMCSSWKYLFAAVKGGTYSHILTRDAAGAWQYYARIPTAGIWVREMWLSDAPDAIDRLWCIFGSASHPGYFLNPMVNPLQAATYSYVPTGYFTNPIHDGGMAEEPGAYYDEVITCDGIGGDNKITSLYGLNGAAVDVTLGVVATITETLKFGSPYGLEAYRIQPKFQLAGADSGTTSIFRDAIVHYLKLPKEREAFDFVVDLEQTAIREVRPLEAVIGSLNSERASRTLMPFWYGQVATKAVKVLNMPSDEDVEDDKIFQGERQGIIKIRVAEIT